MPVQRAGGGGCKWIRHLNIKTIASIGKILVLRATYPYRKKRWKKFQNTDLSNSGAWSRLYRKGDQSFWDHSFPSPELVGYVLAGAHLKPGMRVLDVGCGSGRDSVFLASRNLEVHALDFAPEAIEIAKQRARASGVTVNWHECSVLDTPFETAYFDFITDRGCFHHIGGERRGRYATEVARILKPGGKLFLRGCRKPTQPFHVITDETIEATFDKGLFDYSCSAAVSFKLVVNSGGLEATAVTITRLP